MIAALLVIALAALGPESARPLSGSPPAVAVEDTVTFTATLSADTIMVGRRVTLELLLETTFGRSGQIHMPTLPPELEVVSTSDYTRLNFSFPGGRTRSLRREVEIYASAPGVFRIPPATARLRGVIYRTPELTLTVLGSDSPSATPTPPRAGGLLPGLGANARGPRDEALIQGYVYPDTVYVNQQVTFVARAFIDDEIRFWLHRTPTYRHPTPPPGLWTQSLRGPTQPRLEWVNDRSYRVQEFHRAYFPLAPGSYVIPPVRMEYRLRRSFRNDPESRVISSDSVRFEVLPLPTEGRPDDFDGAVGSYSISARIEPASVPVGEAASLIVEVEGIGNVEALPAPRLPAIDGVDFMAPAEDAAVEVDQGSVGGTKTFTWMIVPQRAGRIEVPPIEYHFFDPGEHRYRTAHSEPLILQSTGVAEEGRGAAPSVTSISGPRSEPARDARIPALTAPVLALIIGAPLLALLPLAIGRKRRRRGDSGPRRQIEELRSRLKELERLRDDGIPDDELYRALAAIIRHSAAIVADDPAPVGGAADSIGPRLRAAGIPNATASALAELLARIEGARYRPAPPTPGEGRALLAETEKLIALLALHLKKAGAARAHAAASALIALFLTGSFSPAIAAEDEKSRSSSFQTGLELYQDGDFRGAATVFAGVLHHDPGDPHAWYNLGISHFRSGDRGPALHAWLSALRLSPRDPDIRQSLASAGAHPDLVGAAAPFLPLSPREHFDLSLLLWLSAAAALALYGITRRSWYLWIGAAAAAASVIIGALALAPLLGDEVALTLDAETPVRVAPDHRAGERRQLPAGTRLQVEDRRGDWLLVSTHRGKAIGWVEDRLVGRLLTPPSIDLPR